MKILITVLVSFFLWSNAFAKPYELAICAIFQNESRWLKEWLDFHLDRGVEHFYLYDNLSTDDYLEVLEPYIKKNVVDVINWPIKCNGEALDWILIQSSSYYHCSQKIKNNVKWCAFIDIDEFLFSPERHDLREELHEYKNYDAVGVNWVLYGTGGVKKLDPGAKLTKNLLYRSEFSFPENDIIKCIVRPSKILACENPHYFILQNHKLMVNENKQIIMPPFKSKNSVSKLRINHYWAKDKDYFYNEKIRRRLDTGMDKDIERIITLESKMNLVYDPILAN